MHDLEKTQDKNNESRMSGLPAHIRLYKYQLKKNLPVDEQKAESFSADGGSKPLSPRDQHHCKVLLQESVTRLHNEASARSNKR